MTQTGLFVEGLDPEDDPKDSWCTEPKIMDIAHRLWPGGIDLDCCSNRAAVSLGFVRARVAWTKADDCTKQATWKVGWRNGAGCASRVTCWGQPPYSRQSAPIIDHFCTKVWDAGELWEALWLVKHDTSTKHWAQLEKRSTSIVMFKDRIGHYADGVRVDASNLMQTMHFFTRADPNARHRALEAAVGDLGWVYR